MKKLTVIMLALTVVLTGVFAAPAQGQSVNAS